MATEVRSVTLSSVHYRIGSTVVLRGLDGQLDSGRLHLIVGSNGSGKTTLLRIIAMLLRPSSGRIDYAPLARPDLVRRSLGCVFHDSLSYPDLTVEQNLRFAATMQDSSTGSVVEAIVSRFRLDAVLQTPLRTLSRGQRQRVALARALVHRPTLMLFDEPTTGLDADGVDLLLAFLREEVGVGRILLAVTHAPEQFGDLDPVIWRLDKGSWCR